MLCIGWLGVVLYGPLAVVVLILGFLETDVDEARMLIVCGIAFGSFVALALRVIHDRLLTYEISNHAICKSGPFGSVRMNWSDVKEAKIRWSGGGRGFPPTMIIRIWSQKNAYMEVLVGNAVPIRHQSNLYYLLRHKLGKKLKE